MQTDPISDDLIQLKIVQVLNLITASRMKYYLSDETAWNIVEGCYSLLMQSGTNVTFLLYLRVTAADICRCTLSDKSKYALLQLAEQTLCSALNLIFCSSRVSMDVDYVARNGTTGSKDDRHAVNTTLVHPKNARLSTHGLPCAMKVLGFFVNSLQRFAADTSQSPRSPLANGQPSNGISMKSLSTSRPPLSRSQTPLIESEYEPEVTELLLSLKCIHAMLLGDGDLERPRDLILRYMALSHLGPRWELSYIP